MPTFADAEAAIAARDYRAALSILEALDVVGEDACYRRDIQAAACADRLGLFPLCEEYATRAHFYGDDMADPFALMARAQRRQGPAPPGPHRRLRSHGLVRRAHPPHQPRDCA